MKMQKKYGQQSLGGNFTPSEEPLLVGFIIGGNTLTGSIPGIKYGADQPIAATKIDPYTDPALDDGLGYAYLYSDGVQQIAMSGTNLVPKRVLVQHYIGSSIIPYAMLKNEVVKLGYPTFVPTEINGISGVNTAYNITGF